MQPNLWAVLWLGSVCHGQEPFESAFQRVIQQMESDIVELAQHVERLYEERCDTNGMLCDAANFDHCRSEFPAPNCTDDAWSLADDSICGNCSGRYDDTISAVRLVQFDHVVNDPATIESLCMSRPLDDWFRQKQVNDSAFWTDLGIRPSLSYFASSTGVFRGFPARPSQTCFDYDPRVRPWYLAASSGGPRNVVLILDISGAMQGRLAQLQWAARHVVTSLTADDWVALVVFASTAHMVDPFNATYRFLVPATDAHKAHLVQAIMNVTLGERTNYYDALELAFDVVNRSATKRYRYTDCHTAFLLVTGSVMDLPVNVTEAQVMERVRFRMGTTTGLLSNAIQWFTYSIGETNQVVHEFPRQLACEFGRGIWSSISATQQVKDVVSSYVDLFAWGLLGARRLSWVKPYTFTTGHNVRGSTVSMPVFDTTAVVPIFLGVVGMDIALDPLIEALGGQVGEDVVEFAMDNQFENAATCHAFQLTDCQLHAYRSSKGLTCPTNVTCTETIRVELEPCTNVVYPTVPWNNVNYLTGLKLVDDQSRMCCGSNESFGSCEAPVVPAAPLDIEAQIIPPVIVPSATPSPVLESRSSTPGWRTYLAITCLVLIFTATVVAFVKYARNRVRRETLYYY